MWGRSPPVTLYRHQFWELCNKDIPGTALPVCLSNTLYIDYYYLETFLILPQVVLLLTYAFFFYVKASAVVDLEEEDDDLFQSARLEPEMSKFVGNTNGFSSRCTKKPYGTYYFTSFSCYHFAVLLSLYTLFFSHCALKRY